MRIKYNAQVNVTTTT